jgi:Flp pilus assembly protein TadD
MKRTALTTALILGLAAPAFAASDLTAQQFATLEAVSTSEDDFATEAFKREQFATGGIVSTQSGISAGHAQLAASYGLDPVEYSVAELVIIAGESDEEERARFIAAYAGDDGAVISSQGSGKAHIAKAVELFGGPENNRE